NPKPNNPTQNGPTPSDDSTGMGGATPPDSSVVSNDSTTSKNTVAPKNQKMPKSPVLTDKQGVKKTAQAGRRLPKTGEGANPTLYAWMLGALGSMLVLVGYRKRKTVK
ncbi:LPXTG cell wall anchor domain-containing protein, partial [Filifactor alocis]